jgi:seryl-tRNA synthetase
MLDIRFIRANADLVQQNAKDKGYDVNIAELLKKDEGRRELQKKADDLREKRNTISTQLEGGRPSDAQIVQAKVIKEELTAVETALGEIERSFDELLGQVPNVTQPDVPVGDEKDSIEVKRWGDQTSGAIDHLDFAVKRDWIDFERGAKVAGAKFYYLKGELALLENAITQFALSLVAKRGFTYLSVPYLVNSRTATGSGFLPRTSEQSDEYHVENEDLSLVATAEIPLTGYHSDEILGEAQLPLFYAAYSPSFRKEAGTYGKHNRGLFRVHQFNKLELYAFTLPEQSAEVHEKILAIEEEIWQALGIPYHVINIASGDLGAPASKKYDLEYWSPVDGIYRELTSASNCTDFQARNLNIRVRRADGNIDTVHTLNGTAVSLARSLVAILEHYQNSDGTLRVPEVLQMYLGGQKTI